MIGLRRLRILFIQRRIEYVLSWSTSRLKHTYILSPRWHLFPGPHAPPYESQRMGENGPLLQVFHLIDLLSYSDQERIPKRVVHAKGSGAHGIYKTTDSLSDLCLADMFQKRKECPFTVRFSTVGGEPGSHDCARDPKGFLVKFKTDEGVWDLVVNNTPVFFLRDACEVPSLHPHTETRPCHPPYSCG
jgi:catalase